MRMNVTDVIDNTLTIECKNELGALERLLRVVRFRGFSVTNLNARLDDDGQLLNIDLSVSSERPLHLLTNQLRKNYEVNSVQVTASQPEQAHAHDLLKEKTNRRKNILGDKV